MESIRQGAAFRDAAEGGSTPEAFLQQANAVIEIDFTPAPGDTRVLELVKKTNQFNLNGIRFTDSDWSRTLSAPAAFVGVISYEDKFGPPGKIAVVQGRVEPKFCILKHGL
jgi:predicted enzyme involved in methoxymalonyl-ACP biosynthesis